MKRALADASRGWNGLRRAVREKVAHSTPTVLVMYPFEVFAAGLALIVGLPLLLGLAKPGSLVLLLPMIAYIAYAVSLCLGSIIVFVALARRHAYGLASGLQLVGGSYAVYALAVVLAAGWTTAWAAFAAFALLGLLCVLRSSHFRRLIDIKQGAQRLSSGDTS